MDISDSVTYFTGERGKIEFKNPTSKPDVTGVDQDGFAFWNDLHLRSDFTIQLDLSESHHAVNASEQHIVGESVIKFEVSPDQSMADFDVRITGLQSGEWYALEINGRKRLCRSGVTDGTTDSDGVLSFYEIEL